MKSILLVDDELAIALQLRECLLDYGYSVEVAGTFESALDSINNKHFDAILVEFNLRSERSGTSRSENGTRLVSQLRDSGISAPIMMFTVMKGARYESASRDAGADDFILKPIAVPELVVRLSANIQDWDCGRK